MTVKSYKVSNSIPIYNLAAAKVSGIKNKKYNGRKQTQKAVLKMGKVKLKNGRDYKVSYRNNRKKGTATIIFVGKGRYSGTLKNNFKITPKKKSANR